MTEKLDFIPEDNMATEKKIEYNTLYNRDRTTTVNIRLNYNTDEDILTYLESVPNKQGLIKTLLRQYIADNPLPTSEDN